MNILQILLKIVVVFIQRNIRYKWLERTRTTLDFLLTTKKYCEMVWGNRNVLSSLNPGFRHPSKGSKRPTAEKSSTNIVSNFNRNISLSFNFKSLSLMLQRKE